MRRVITSADDQERGGLVDSQGIKMHMAAARDAGKESACGEKFQHDSEDAAWRAANHLNRRPEVETGERHRVEPYPCPFCSPYPELDGWYFWHVGREMTPEERERWAETTQ